MTENKVRLFPYMSVLMKHVLMYTQQWKYEGNHHKLYLLRYQQMVSWSVQQISFTGSSSFILHPVEEMNYAT